MPLTVVSFAQYLTVPAAMRSSDFAGLNFINCLKDKAFIGQYSEVPVNGTIVRIDKDSGPMCLKIFSDWASDRIIENKFSGPICLVPVPNKSALSSVPDDDFPTAKIARKIHKKFTQGVSYHASLRWDQPLQKARDGGPRSASALYPHLVLLPIPASFSRTVVLVDDVCTSGGHLQACAAKLKKAGFTVNFAICAGKTCDEQQSDPFVIPLTVIPDFDPDASPFW